MNEKQRHAYLIMAHDQPELLKKLIRALDDERNDLYLHIDKKTTWVRQEDLQTAACRCGLVFVKRRSVVWAGESQILCEMDLFRKAAEQRYSYYHLISGADFPICSQDRIHDFFQNHQGKEFIEFWNRPEKEYLDRIRYRHTYQERIGHFTNDPRTLFLRVCSKLQELDQKRKGTDRVRDYGKPVKCGSQWVSVTDDFVRYLLGREEEIKTYFLQGIAADELYKQSVCWNSPFRERVWPEGNVRLIDWNRGQPYTWQEDDLNEIVESGALFVRKVTEQNRLADLLLERIMK